MNEPTPPPFKSAFHGKGAAAYTSVASRRKFAKSLLQLSSRLYWAPFAAILASAYTGRIDAYFWTLAIVCIALFAGATYARHYALVICDSLPEKKPRMAKPRANKKQPKAAEIHVLPEIKSDAG